MKPLRSILAASLALAFLSTPARAITYQVVADTTGSNTTFTSTKAAGAATSLSVGAKTSAFINFRVFDSLNQPPATAVTAARLIIYVQKVTKPGSLNVFVNGSAITEAGGASPAIASSFFSVGLTTAKSKTFLVIDVTTQVVNWLNGSVTNFGFGFSATSPGSFLLGSKEGSGSGYPAVIEVDVAGPAEQAVSQDGNGLVFSNATLTADRGGFWAQGSSNGETGFLAQGVGTSTPFVRTTSGGIVMDGSGARDLVIDDKLGSLLLRAKKDISLTANFPTTALPQLTILQNGFVGIGTTTPTQAKLVVSGFGANALPAGTYGYLSLGEVNANKAGNFPGLGIYATDSIWTGANYYASSDARMKKIVGGSDRAKDLATLLRIEITDYQYKDAVAKGEVPQKKVIAQQVESVFPQAVSRRMDVVPDIFQKAVCKDGWIELKTDLKKGERVRLTDDKTTSVFEVMEAQADKFRTEFKPAGNLVFVYGREVKDFRVVDYEAIAMLNVSATQELARKLETKDAEIATLKAANLAFAAKMAAFDEKLTALKADLDDRPARAVRASLDLK